MPSWEFIRNMVLPTLAFMVLPALTAAALVMAVVERLGGAKQAAAGAALALCVGAALGLFVRDAAPGMQKDSLQATFAALGEAKTLQTALAAFGNALNLGQSTWSRLPWAILAALVVGRLAYLADVHSSDGWLVRGGAAIAIAWLLLPEADRHDFVWMVPALATTIALLWIILDRLAAQPGSSSVALGVVFSLLVAAQVMLHAGTTSLMDALVVVGFAFIGVALIAYRRGVEFGGAIPAVAVALPALLLMGQRTTYSKLPWIVFALPACAPLLLAVTLPFMHWPKVRLHMVRLVLVLAPLIAAAVLAWHYQPDALDFSGDGSE
jgi:hypothetical protein